MANLDNASLERIRSALDNPQVAELAVVQLAKQDWADGKVEAALQRLRVDADKFFCIDSKVTSLLMTM